MRTNYETTHKCWRISFIINTRDFTIRYFLIARGYGRELRIRRAVDEVSVKYARDPNGIKRFVRREMFRELRKSMLSAVVDQTDVGEWNGRE